LLPGDIGIKHCFIALLYIGFSHRMLPSRDCVLNVCLLALMGAVKMVKSIQLISILELWLKEVTYAVKVREENVYILVYLLLQFTLSMSAV